MSHFCFIIQGFLLKENSNIAGPHVQSYLKAKALIKNSYKVSYICLTEDMDYKNKFEQKDGIDVYYVAKKIKPFRLEELLSFREIFKILDKINPDIVYTRGRTSLPWISYKYCNSKKKLSIWNAARDRDFLRYSYIIEKSNNSFWRLIFSFPFYYITMIFLFEKGLKKCNLILVQNEFQKEMLKKKFNIKNSFLLPQLAPEKESFIKENKNFKVLWIGSLKKEKAPEKYIELISKQYDKSIEFIMVGKILDDKYRFIEKIENENFKYLGHLNYFNTLKLIKESHLLINTSTSEGFPNTFVQAWRYGLMVLSLGINPNNILNGELGFSCKSIDELAEKINYIVKNNLIEKNQKNIEEYIENNHTTSNFIEIINRLINSSNYV